MKTPTKVDKTKLIRIIENIENKQIPKNRSELYGLVAKEYNEDKVTPSVVMLRISEWNIPVKTPKGKRGRQPGVKIERKPREDKFKDPKIQSGLKDLKKEAGEKYNKTVDRIGKGSMKSAIKMKCLDCSGYDKKEVKNCTVYNCSLYPFRPYK